MNHSSVRHSSKKFNQYLEFRGQIALINQRIFWWLANSINKVKDEFRDDNELKPIQIPLSPNSTSVTDTNEFKKYCSLISSNSKEFRTFRSHPILIDALEHVPSSLTGQYLEIVLISRSKHLLVGLLKSDSLGKPRKNYTREVGRVSSTSSRYAKITDDLARIFRFDFNPIIVEIGAGYGGQARFLAHALRLTRYHLVDLKEVEVVAKKFLELSCPFVQVNTSFQNEIPPDIDLLVSNYAFSELGREAQELYFRDYISKAKRGYVTYNNLTPLEWNSMSAKEFISKIPGSVILEEHPESAAGNKLIVWGHIEETVQ